MVLIPGRRKTKDENIDILFKALRDPANRELIPQIKRALKIAGCSDIEVLHYQRTGKHLSETKGEWSDFEKEFDEMDREFRDSFGRGILKPQVRRLRALRNMAVMAFLVSAIIAIGVTFWLVRDDTDKSGQTDPPPITESASMEDGDKL